MSHGEHGELFTLKGRSELKLQMRRNGTTSGCQVPIAASVGDDVGPIFKAHSLLCQQLIDLMNLPQFFTEMLPKMSLA